MIVDEIADEHLINLSLDYAREYKIDGKNFLNTFKKFKSVRMACESIVSAYRRCGAMKEIEETGVCFKPFAYKYLNGQDAKILANILLIIYAITNEKLL